MAARHARITARLGTQARQVDGLSLAHGFDLDSAGIPGLDGQVEWADAPPTTVPAIPTDAEWDRAVGESLRIDWTDEQGTVRVATARLDASAGDGLGGVSTALTDWTSRLSTEIEIRPVAATRARNTGLAGSVKRRMNLVPTWLTVEALRQAGWNTCQAMQTSAVAYHQMGGSATASPDPGSTYLPMGDVRQCYRLNAYGDVDVTDAPGVTQGDDLPVMRNLYLLGQTRTRRRSNVAHWQMTQDLGVRKPETGDIGRSTVRPLRSSDGAGMRLDWDEANVRVQRVNTNGTVSTLGTYPRGESMRWSVVIRANGTATVYNDLSGSTPVAQLTSTGVTALPTGSGAASYLLEWPGRASAFQLTRSDSPFLVTQTVGARVHRHAYSGRWIAGFDYVTQRAAGDFLAHQARAQVGWRGIGLCQWVDEDGRLINSDFYSLASGPIEHVLDTRAADENALDSAAWSAATSGPWRSVAVTARRPNLLLRDEPTLLLGEGSRETVPRGERLEQFIHPETDQTWLSIDTSAYLPGHPYPPPTNKEYDNQHGTWTGGHKVDEDGKPAGWITINDVVEWSLNANGEVRGALTVLDPATVLVSGTVNTPVGLSMSTMPSPASSGLPEHRKSQPLAQIRGTELIEWDEHAITVPVTGDDRHQGYTHDLGMFVTNPTEMQYAADELAASITDPALIYTARVANNPRVRVGQKVALRHTYASGWTRTVVGVVAHRRIDLGGSDEDVMTLRVVRTSDTTTAPAAPLPPPDPTPPTPAPPIPPGPRPDPDPPIDPADPPTIPPPPTPSTPTVDVDVNLLRIGWDGLDATGASATGLNFGALEVAVTDSPFTSGGVVGRAELEDDGWHRLVHGPVPLDTTRYVRVRILDIWGQEGPWSVAVVVQVDPLVDPAQFEDALARILDAEEGLDDLAADLADLGAALPDPEFTDPTAWDVPSGSTWHTDLTDHPYGRATGLTVPAGANTTAAVATLPVEPGQRWWTAVLVRPEASSTSPSLAGLEVQWLRESGTVLSTHWVDSRPLRDYTADEWVLLSGYAVAPDDAAGVRVRVRRTLDALAPAWTLASARLLRASGGVADPVVLAGFIGALRIDVAQLVVTEGATINEAVILKLAADLAEFVEVKAENILAGAVNVLLNLTAGGEVTAGTLTSGGRSFMRGGPAGGIGFEVPDRTGTGDPVVLSQMGKDWIARNSDGDVTASIEGETGAVSGEKGTFAALEAGGIDVVKGIADRPKLIAYEDTGLQSRGPYFLPTGYRSWGFSAEAGHAYRVECTVHVVAGADAGGTHYTYLRQTTDGSPVTLDSAAHASDDSSLSNNGEGRFRMYYYYIAPGARDVRVGVSARKTGDVGAGFRFARAVFSVVDEGPFEPLVDAGRWDLLGATGAPPPDPTPQPRRYEQAWDFDWHEVYQASGRVNRDASGVGNNLRQGRFGSHANYPFATLLRVPDAARSSLMGSIQPRVYIQLTSLFGSGSVIVGQATTSTSSSPASFPTPISPTIVGTLSQGATRELQLPSAWASRWIAGTNRSLTLGRLDSAGFNDRLIDFRGLTGATNVRARLIARWEK